MKKANKEAAAKALFFEGWTQTRIAEAIQVTETTLSKWAAAGNWREERAKKLSLEESNTSRVLYLLDYQLETMTAQVDQWRGGPVEKRKLIDKGEIDALSKLFSAIKGKDLVWTQYVEVTKQIMVFVSLRDNELSKLLIPHTDAFLMEKRENLTQ